jgi:hypothetical protein
MAQNKEYMLFLDETKRNPDNPYFCVAGFAISREDYEGTLIPSINKFKISHFGNTDVIFHFAEMKKGSGEFSHFADAAIRTKFWSELYNLLKGMPLVTFGCYFDSDKMKTIYPDRATTLYDIALHYIVENYVHYLRSVGGTGSITLESRTMKENQLLHDYFNSIEANGTLYYSKNDIRKYISSVGYIIKKDNCIGLQIADLIPTYFVRLKNNRTDNHNLGKMWMDKLYGADKGFQDILGLKKIL